MKSKYVCVAAIVALGTVVSGLFWLLVYSLRFHEGIGFDGPAGGILGMTLVGGWFVSSIIAVVWYKRRKFEGIILPIIVAVATGVVVVLGTGYAISSYAQSRYPDGGRHFVE